MSRPSTKTNPRLEAEAFLLKPVIEFLRGYSKITEHQPALLNAELVLQDEINGLLAARDRVLEAFYYTVEHDGSGRLSPDTHSHHYQDSNRGELGVDYPPRGRSRWRFGPPGTAPDYSGRQSTTQSERRKAIQKLSAACDSRSLRKQVCFPLLIVLGKSPLTVPQLVECG